MDDEYLDEGIVDLRHAGTLYRALGMALVKLAKLRCGKICWVARDNHWKLRGETRAPFN